MKKILISLFIVFVIVFISCEKIYANNNLIAGNTAFQNKDYILTIKYYKKEIKKNNTNAQVYSQYCGVESYLYDTNKSINLKNTLSICNKAIELNPSSAETYFYKCYNENMDKYGQKTGGRKNGTPNKKNNGLN